MPFSHALVCSNANKRPVNAYRPLVSHWFCFTTCLQTMTNLVCCALAQTVALPCSNAESTRVISGSHLCHHKSVATNTMPWTIPTERQSYPNVTPMFSPFWTRLAANICPPLKSAATPHRTPRPYCVKCCDALKGPHKWALVRLPKTTPTAKTVLRRTRFVP